MNAPIETEKSVFDLPDEAIVGKRPAARFIGVRPATLDKWACTGGGPTFVRIGRLRRYQMADLRAYVRSRRVTPPAA